MQCPPRVKGTLGQDSGVESAFVLKYWILMQFAKWIHCAGLRDLYRGSHWIAASVFSHVQWQSTRVGEDVCNKVQG